MSHITTSANITIKFVVIGDAENEIRLQTVGKSDVDPLQSCAFPAA